MSLLHPANCNLLYPKKSAFVLYKIYVNKLLVLYYINYIFLLQKKVCVCVANTIIEL